MSDISPTQVTPASLKRQASLDKQMRTLARQIASREAFLQACEEGNPAVTAQIDKEFKNKARSLEERSSRRAGLEKKSPGLLGLPEAEALAMEAGDANPELDSRTLLLLRENLSDSDTDEDVLKKVLDVYADYSLADDALAYLEKTSSDARIRQVREARGQLNQNYGREILAGKNISAEARVFSEQGLGTPTALRDMYRDITGNPRTPNKLFTELSEKFAFEQLKTVIRFLLNSLGRDLKSLAPSMEPGFLTRLMTDTRSLQAILGVYRFFKSKMNVIYRFFDKHHLYYPKKMTFEKLAKLYMKFLEERYPNAAKVIKLAQELEISDDLLAQVIIFTQYRDAVRQIAPQLYRDSEHRQNLLNAFIEALEELDERIEGDEEDAE